MASKKARSKWYPVETITMQITANDLMLLTNTLAENLISAV